MAKSRICSVSDCGNLQKGRGLCSKHLQRFSNHGDPLAGRNPNGDQQKFYDSVVLSYEGQECLLWPYIRDKNGYARMRHGGRMAIVSRFLCEDIYGPPPTPEHEAAHSCGKGHLACVAKGHLSWKVRLENRADMIIHGTIPKGERNGRAKLTERQVKEIIALKGNEHPQAIADRFGISRATIYDIHSGRSWAMLAAV